MFLSQAAYAICTVTYGGKIHASNMASITAEIYTTLYKGSIQSIPYRDLRKIRSLV